MAQQLISVRIASAYSIFKEEGADATESGRPYDIHITGFDAAGHPVRPIVEVPRTFRVLRAIQEGRLIDVDRAEGGIDAQREDVARLKANYAGERGVAANLYGAGSDAQTAQGLKDLGVVNSQPPETDPNAGAESDKSAKK